MMGPMTRIVSFARVATVAATLGSLGSSDAIAQQPAGSWQGWLGCWTAEPVSAGLSSSAVAPLVCITPTANASVVEVATISGDQVVSTQRIDASGRELPMDAKGCTGTQQARWSADGRRVFLKAVAKCDGVERVTSGIIAMSPSGEWLDVQGIAAGGGEAVRVARYRDPGLSSAVPEQIAATLRGRGVATQGARFATGATIGSSAVIEASRVVMPAVVEAWLLERGQMFALDARELERLADAGVPARVTDAMVAVSNPLVFAVARPEKSSGRGARDEDDISGQRIPVYLDPMYSPYRWGYGAPGYGYGSGYYGYPGYRAPFVVNAAQTVSRGQAVKGRGYTQSEPGSASPSGSRGSGSSSNSGSSSSEPARSGPAPRTAHPKP